MGEPFPPPWEPGGACTTCEDVIFDGVTPIFVYAFAQDIIKCPGAPPALPNPNHVIRMTQQALQPCVWEANFISGIFKYTYLYWFTVGFSYMTIQELAGWLVFYNRIMINCQDHFTNELVCGAPFFPAFSGGTVDCFW